MLVDTNVLLRTLQQGHPQFQVATGAIRQLCLRQIQLEILPQNLVEFWAVATRPGAANGLGLSTIDASLELQSLRRLFHMLPETPAMQPTWERLVTRLHIVGKSVHDARLAAGMLVHGVDAILTFDARDFNRYGVTVVHPARL